MILCLNEQIACFYARALGWAVGKHTLGLEASTGFDPPDAVSRQLIVVFLNEIEGRKNRSSNCEKGQEEDRDTSLQ